MSRIPPATREVFEPQFGADAPLRHRVYANAPALAAPYVAWQTALRECTTLPGRLVELVRLRVAFHNQCRSCMAVRYGGALDEGAVCSLEKPQEAPDLTPAEKAALAYADLMATDHLAVDDAVFARLQRHFSDSEVMELCFHVGSYVGFGRMGSTLAMVDDLTDEYTDLSAPVAPWTAAPVHAL
ncbi:carboxymuconolactone decarboxylase family protein [Monashia sp. NPDC004114]